MLCIIWFFPSTYVLLLNAFPLETMASVSLVSWIWFFIILFHMPNINQAFIIWSHWNSLHKALWFKLPLHDVLMHEQRRLNHQSDHIIYGKCCRVMKYYLQKCNVLWAQHEVHVLIPKLILLHKNKNTVCCYSHWLSHMNILKVKFPSKSSLNTDGDAQHECRYK